MFQKWYNKNRERRKMKMSKLRKITRDDFNDTMNRLYIYGGPLSGYDFSNHDLRELNIGCYTEKYINCDFSNSDMTYMDMRDISFVGCNFTNAKLDSANFTNTRLESCSFENASMIGVELIKADIDGTSFDNAKLSSANLSNATLVNSTFVDADLSDSKFSNTVVRSTLFTDSDVSRVDFTFTMLNGYSLSNLKEAKNLDLTLREMAINSKGGCKKIVSSGK